MALIRTAHSSGREELFALWERSVRATHAFLAEEDILFYRPLVRTFLFSDAAIWTACADGGTRILGFMVLELPPSSGSSGKVEALFVDPAAFRQGAGSLLLRHARLLAHPLTLDVNEQNPVARAFYARAGFRELGRSPEDSFGRPFPLVHMRLD